MQTKRLTTTLALAAATMILMAATPAGAQFRVQAIVPALAEAGRANPPSMDITAGNGEGIAAILGRFSANRQRPSSTDRPQHGRTTDGWRPPVQPSDRGTNRHEEMHSTAARAARMTGGRYTCAGSLTGTAATVLGMITRETTATRSPNPPETTGAHAARAAAELGWLGKNTAKRCRR